MQMDTNVFRQKPNLHITRLLKYDPSFVENLLFLAFSSDRVFDCKMSLSDSNGFPSGMGREAA
jgi:hypothetical protein